MHFLMIKEEDITIESLYLPNNMASKYMQRKTELKGEIDKMTSIASNFNIHLNVTNRISHKKINKDIEDLTMQCTNLTYIQSNYILTYILTTKDSACFLHIYANFKELPYKLCS